MASGLGFAPAICLHAPMMAKGVGTKRGLPTGITRVHAHTRVLQVCKCIEWNEKKSEDGRRTGPYKGRKLAT